MTTPASASDPQAGDQRGEDGGEARDRLRSPDRVLALSDGVFAIILTILVRELKVPPNLSQESLGAVFEELRPTLVAWVISFLITGMYWVAHRDLFARSAPSTAFWCG